MVNRVLQAKIFKMKRRGRHRKYSQLTVNSGKSVNKERMKTYFHDPSTFMEPPPATLYLKGQTITPRLRAKLREQFLKDMVKPLTRVYETSDAETVRLVFTSKMDVFIFFRHNTLYNYVQESITYGSLTRANEVWAQQSIRWKEPLQLE